MDWWTYICFKFRILITKQDPPTFFSFFLLLLLLLPLSPLLLHLLPLFPLSSSSSFLFFLFFPSTSTPSSPPPPSSWTALLLQALLRSSAAQNYSEFSAQAFRNSRLSCLGGRFAALAVLQFYAPGKWAWNWPVSNSKPYREEWELRNEKNSVRGLLLPRPGCIISLVFIFLICKMGLVLILPHRACALGTVHFFQFLGGTILPHANHSAFPKAVPSTRNMGSPHPLP